MKNENNIFCEELFSHHHLVYGARDSVDENENESKHRILNS